MHWRRIITDFNKLISDLVTVHGVSKTSLADHLGHDKVTITRWMKETAPYQPSDVANVIRFALQRGVDLGQYQTFEPIYDVSHMLTYEQKRQNPVPDLSWLTNVQPPPSASFDFRGIKLDSPIGVSSSPLVSDQESTALILDLGFGLITLKTRRTGQKTSWSAPQIAFVREQPDLLKYDPAHPPETLVTFDRQEVKMPIPNMVNSIGIPSELPTVWQEVYERIKEHPRGQYVGLSVVGDGKLEREIENDFVLAVEKAKDVRPPFIELNPSCPNLEKNKDVYEDPALVRRICARAQDVLKGTGILLSIKLPPMPYENIYALLKTIGPKIDVVAFRNTIRVRPITINREKIAHPAFGDRQFGGLSGPCTFGVTRKGLIDLVRIRKELKQEFGIIAIGGVTTHSDVVELLNAGADVVQACTAPMFDPLLAWKVRFHFWRTEAALPKKYTSPDDPLFLPRNQYEIESFKNLHKAVGEIERRSPGFKVPYEVVRTNWNEWMEQRSSLLMGKAQRLSLPRTRSTEEWMKGLTS